MKSPIDTLIYQPKSALSLLAGSAETALDLEALLEAIQAMDGVILEKDNVILEKDDIIQKKSFVIEEQKKRAPRPLLWISSGNIRHNSGRFNLCRSRVQPWMEIRFLYSVLACNIPGSWLVSIWIPQASLMR